MSIFDHFNADFSGLELRRIAESRSVLTHVLDGLRNGSGFFGISLKDFGEVVLPSLRAFSETRLAYEDAAMESAKYPHLEAHKADHRRFEATINSIARKFLTEDSAGAETELRHFLESWIESHVGKLDQDYREYAEQQARKGQRPEEPQTPPPSVPFFEPGKPPGFYTTLTAVATARLA